VSQDAFFLDAFARAYALALARSPDRHGLEAFHGLIGGVLDELRLHAGYAAEWQVDLAHIEPGLATLAYTEFLLATASLGTVVETCAAMTPCMRLYAFLGQSLAANGADRPDNPYRAWIQTYAAAEFEQLAEQLEGLLDRYASDVANSSKVSAAANPSIASAAANASDERNAAGSPDGSDRDGASDGSDLPPRIQDAYRRALQLELAFFDAHLPDNAQLSGTDLPKVH
jgi:thiaminase